MMSIVASITIRVVRTLKSEIWLHGPREIIGLTVTSIVSLALSDEINVLSVKVLRYFIHHIIVIIDYVLAR